MYLGLILKIILLVFSIILLIIISINAILVHIANRNFKKNLHIFNKHILDNYPNQTMIYSTFCNICTTTNRKEAPLLIWMTFTNDYLVMAIRVSDKELNSVNFMTINREDVTFKREYFVGLEMKLKLSIEESDVLERSEENEETRYYLRINKKTRKEIMTVVEYNRVMFI